MFKNVYQDDIMKKAQHDAVRNTVGWYLWTHQLLVVTGEDADSFLDKMFAKPIANLKIGKARYTTMLNEEGIIIDDVVIFRLEEKKFWITTLFVRKMIAWFDQHKGDSSVAYTDETPSWEMYAVQGPNSKALINAIAKEDVEDQSFFSIRDNKIDDIPVKITRAGFTGEKMGFEIYVAPDKAPLIEAKLAEAGKAFDALQVTEFQVMVWTLATEKGFYLMGDIAYTNPFEVGLERGIKWDRDFIGKEALEKVKEEGPKRQMVGFVVDNEEAHIPDRAKGGPGVLIYVDGKAVGRVAKFTYGFTAGRSIGIAVVDSENAKIGDRAVINGYDATLTDRVFVS
ncbi:aminomethyltransferase family protein [Fusibacter paucivorans]|uniref:Aminomethyltransferase family protein n=1 Tax=Fusibacter paucivorans TaxID=76009 RepID=A0ABS5PMM4_9FIRM|nr:aminomethyltransferase family protein [Fusibacter paucivorans]MBS7525302.1 aminomethyltransferase family protein [Fusibacter paucivorans]